MPNATEQGSRAWSLRVRAADCFAAALVGWLALAMGIDKLRPDASRLEKELLLLAFSALCGVAGLFLVNLAGSLERRTTAASKIIPLIRLGAAAAVGGFLLSKFTEGCFAAMGVIFFAFFLVLVFRALDEPRKLADSSRGPEIISPESQPRTTPEEASQPGVLTPGVRGKLDTFVARIASGLTAGLLVGCARYFFDLTGREGRVLESKLFPFSIVVLALTIRFAMAWLVQGRDHLRGWKATLVGMDGLLAGVLLAAAMSSPQMPFSIYFQHLLERHPISWILAGVGLGLIFGLAMSMIAKAVGAGFKGYLFGSRNVRETNVSALANPVPAGNDPGKPLSEGVTGNSTPPQLPARPGSSVGSVGRIGCSCLLAPLALFTSLVFFLLQGFFPPNGPSKPPSELPKGCPPKCEGITLRNYDLSGVDLSRANFEGTKLPDTVLRSANLRGANLRQAYLFWSDLRDADLSDADLSGADLRRAILYGAHLERTNLRGAYLREAALQNVDLSTADLQGADLRGASYTQGTMWPPGFDVNEAGMYLVKQKSSR